MSKEITNQDAFPLAWPMQWKRTPVHQRQSAIFRTGFGKARDMLVNEVRKLGGRNLVISSNNNLRKDGLPYANQREPEDVGVAVYFDLFGKQQCVPCDKWTKVTDNLYAIALCIEALRGLERWGAKDMVQASFTGFAALPDYTSANYIDYFEGVIDLEHLRERYKNLAKELHPDAGGNANDFAIMQSEYEAKKRSLV